MASSIHAFSHLEGARVGAGAHVGPFARLRPGAALGPQGEGRQFRRDQERRCRRRRQGQPPDLYRRRERSARTRISAPAPSPATTMASASAGPTSGRAPSSARIPRSSRPVTIGEGAYVGSGSVITAGRPGRRAWRSRAAARPSKEGWARAFRERSLAAKAGKSDARGNVLTYSVTQVDLSDREAVAR